MDCPRGAAADSETDTWRISRLTGSIGSGDLFQFGITHRPTRRPSRCTLRLAARQ